MTCDLITQWCVHCDFPLFRAHLAKYRNFYNKIIIYPSHHHGVIDLEAFLKEVLPETWVEKVAIDYGKEDWRQAETIPCLSYSDAEWIRFAEADFFVKNWDKFYADVEKAMQTSDMIGMWNPTHTPYIHPSCLFIKRAVLEETNKDFSAHPEINGADHFAMITQDVKKKARRITSIQNMGYGEWEDMFHLGGLTYVYQNYKEDGSNPIGVKRPEIFALYNQMLRNAPVKQIQDFINLTYKVEKQLVDMGIVPDSSWKGFFQ